MGPERNNRRGLGVRASGSLGSSETLVMGRPLTTDSTSHIKVRSPSSSRGCSFRQVNSTPYLLTVLLPWRMNIGPKTVHPYVSEGGSEGRTPSSGRLAIFCFPSDGCLLLQSKHLLKTRRREIRAWTIQYFSLIKHLLTIC